MQRKWWCPSLRLYCIQSPATRIVSGPPVGPGMESQLQSVSCVALCKLSILSELLFPCKMRKATEEQVWGSNETRKDPKILFKKLHKHLHSPLPWPHLLPPLSSPTFSPVAPNEQMHDISKHSACAMRGQLPDKSLSIHFQPNCSPQFFLYGSYHSKLCKCPPPPAPSILLLLLLVIHCIAHPVSLDSQDFVIQRPPFNDTHREALTQVGCNRA